MDKTSNDEQKKGAMETPPYRLFLIVEKFFNGIPRQLQEFIGMSGDSAIYKYISNTGKTKGKSVLGSQFLPKLAQLGINPNWYLTGEGEMLITNTLQMESNLQPTNQKITRRLKVATKAANAGLGFTFSDFELSTTELSYDTEGDNLICFWVSGDSMEPQIPSGSLVEVATDLQSRDGDVIVGTLDGVLICKEYRITDDGFFLHSYNKNYKDIKLNGFQNFVLIGVVTQIIITKRKRK